MLVFAFFLVQPVVSTGDLQARSSGPQDGEEAVILMRAEADLLVGGPIAVERQVIRAAGLGAAAGGPRPVLLGYAHVSEHGAQHLLRNPGEHLTERGDLRRIIGAPEAPFQKKLLDLIDPLVEAEQQVAEAVVADGAEPAIRDGGRPAAELLSERVTGRDVDFGRDLQEEESVTECPVLRRRIHEAQLPRGNPGFLELRCT
ncbi:hypothetical protein [Streptomyces sp. NPDC059850]|uniref:hypothetical protein n=1 Tax=Streptomyces sp. NPDC059850 TaxID=3346970 RepID=UPI003661DFF4